MDSASIELTDTGMSNRIAPSSPVAAEKGSSVSSRKENSTHLLSADPSHSQDDNNFASIGVDEGLSAHSASLEIIHSPTTPGKTHVDPIVSSFTVDAKMGEDDTSSIFNKDGNKVTIKDIDLRPVSFKPVHIPEERAILERFFQETNGSEWKTNTNWGTHRNVCDWHGIVVSRETSRVIKIHLTSNNIKGTVPAYFSGLTELTSLSLSHNELTGSLPPEWSLLSNIQYISLVQNNITGNLPPEWSAMTKLFLLDIASNQISGTLPLEWHSMKKLRQLRLSNNKLTGTLPTKWRDLEELTFVQLQGNVLSGTGWSTFFSTNCTVVVDEDNRNLRSEILHCVVGWCCFYCMPPPAKKPYYDRDSEKTG